VVSRIKAAVTIGLLNHNKINVVTKVKIKRGERNIHAPTEMLSDIITAAMTVTIQVTKNIHSVAMTRRHIVVTERGQMALTGVMVTPIRKTKV
jgi:hypothetical protein